MRHTTFINALLSSSPRNETNVILMLSATSERDCGSVLRSVNVTIWGVRGKTYRQEITPISRLSFNLLENGNDGEAE